MDQDYNPAIDTYVNEIDDEQTIEEEENLSNDSDNSKEIEKLKQESEMPLETLLIMYNIDKKDLKNKYIEKNDSEANLNGNNNNSQIAVSIGEEDDDTDDDDYSGEVDGNLDDDEEDDDSDDNDKSDQRKESELDKNTIHNNNGLNNKDGNEFKYKQNEDLINLINNEFIGIIDNSTLSDEDDCDFDPNSGYLSKKIKIGPEYQIEIENSCGVYDSKNDTTGDYDDLLWSPFKLNETDVIDYLKKLQKDDNFSTLKEDERALNILNECNYNVDNAILKYNELKSLNKINLFTQWTEQENEAFEEGYKEYGKDFRQIHENKCKNYTVGELVHYYYLWKKTERHDVFVNKYKIKKKHHVFHPTATDYMERFILDREQSLILASTSTPATSIIILDSNNDKNVIKSSVTEIDTVKLSSLTNTNLDVKLDIE